MPRKAAAAPAHALLLSQGTILERYDAAESLGRLGVASPWVLRSLQGQLGRRDVRLIAATVTSLGMLGPAAKDAIPQLENIKSWGNKELKALVAAALRQIEKK